MPVIKETIFSVRASKQLTFTRLFPLAIVSIFQRLCDDCCIGTYIDIILTCVYAENSNGCEAASSRHCILHYITVEQTRNSRNNFNHFCVCSNDVTVHRRLPVVLRRPVEVTSGIIRALFDIGDQVFIKIQYNIQRTC